MRVAKAKGRPRGKQPKLNPRQEAHVVDLYRQGEHSTAELADLFGVARSTVYRALQRDQVRGLANAHRAAETRAGIRTCASPLETGLSRRPGPCGTSRAPVHDQPEMPQAVRLPGRQGVLDEYERDSPTSITSNSR